MSLSESEVYEAGMSLPPDVRKHVALRLLESVDPQEPSTRPRIRGCAPKPPPLTTL